jgi:hypothetical protein
MKALTPQSALQAPSVTSDIPLSTNNARDARPTSRMVVRSDLELDCLNESEARSSDTHPSDDAHCEMRPRRREQVRIRDRHHGVGAGDHVSAMRYGDVGLLLGLCSPPQPPAGCPRAARADIEDDDVLPLLLKYTHVVGAS